MAFANRGSMLAIPPTSGTAETAVDTVEQAMLQPAQPPSRAAQPRNQHKRVDHRNQFSLLIVRGDGARVVRFNFPRRLPTLFVVTLGLAACALGVLLTDWWQVRERMRASAHLFQQLEDQQKTIDTFNRRVADLRREVAGWQVLHARIWEPFGPELAPRNRENGIGGGRATPPDRPVRAGVGTELDLLIEQMTEEGQSLRALDRLVTKARRALVALPSRWPVRGSVNSEFGKRLSPWTRSEEFHGGLDIGALPGTPVRAPAPGTVFFAGSHPEFGLTVILDHADNVRTIYGHLSKVLVQHAAAVERGSTVGLVGSTGRSSGPHLHYEVLVKGQPVNPRAYLWD
jgi:murein DD-endopeptidase MepM/ murein hydrolase activator NlpD